MAGQQQAALEQLFPDMHPQLTQQPPYHQRQEQHQLQQLQQLQQQQQQQQVSGAPPLQQAYDILAGDIDQLNEHLQTARVSRIQKTPAAQDTATNPGPTGPPGPPMPSATARGGHQQGAQQRRPDAKGLAPPSDRSRPKERHDRWPGSNGMYAAGRLAQSNSPPMTPAYTQNQAVQVPPHLLQQHFPGQQVFLPPSREMRQAHQQQQQQQQQRQGYWHPHHQQHAALPPWQSQPPRSSSVDDLRRRSSAAASSEASSQQGVGYPHQSQPQPPLSEALPQAGQDQLQEAPMLTTDPAWDALTSSNAALMLNSTQAPVNFGLMPGSVVHGPASVDSPPAPRGIWGDGLHQQRLSKLASDLASVKVAPNVGPAAAEAAAAINFGAFRKEAAPSSSRSAGSTPHAGEAQRARGNFPFDNAAMLNKHRRGAQRFPHNASAQELRQTSSSSSAAPEAPTRRDRAAKLSLDSLTSQAEAAQRQQALCGFELNTEDFPALGGLAPEPGVVASPCPAQSGGRAPHSKAWSETDALSPLVHKSPPE